MAQENINPKDAILKDPNSIVKYYKFDEFRDQYTRYLPNFDFDFVVQDGIYDLKYVKVKFKAKTPTSKINEFVNSQKAELNFVEVTKEDFLEFYKTSQSLEALKHNVRNTIRFEKDLEDDLTDQKIIIQNLLFFVCDLWENVFTPEMKEKSKYKEVLNGIASHVLSDEVRLRANLAEANVFQKILADEIKFANEAKRYLDSKKGE